MSGGSTHIHTNNSTQKRNHVTLLESTNSKPKKTPKRTAPSNQTTQTNKLSKTFDHKQTSQLIKTSIRKGKTSKSKIRCNPTPNLYLIQRKKIS